MELIEDVKYEEALWVKVEGESGRSTLYVISVNMPTDSVRQLVMIG